MYAGSSRISFLGSRTDHIIINDNGQEHGGSNTNGGHGIRTMNTYDWIDRMFGVAVVENAGNGFFIDSISGSADFLCQDSCFAQNGVDGQYYCNVRFDDASELYCTFQRCTFHDAVYNGDDIYIYSTATDTHLTLDDCIVTGNGTGSPSDTLNIHSSSTNGTITCNYCGIILQGPDALLAPDGLYGKKASITQNNSYNGDPDYNNKIETGSPTSDGETFNNGDNAEYLDVHYVYFAGKASGGEDLSGYGDFVGDAVPVELSVFSVD